MSSSVYDQIAGKLDLGFVDIGAKSLKNIDRPVRVYRIERDGSAQSRSVTRRRPRMSPGKVGTAVAILALAVIGAGYFGLLRLPTGEDPEATKAAAARAVMTQELTKARAAAEAARRRAEAEAAAAAEAKRALEEQRAAEARARSEAELARARAEVGAARREATSKLAAAQEAAAAKRQLEQERAANARARAEAELALARAEAEEAKRKAAAELAAAERARRAAEESARTEPSGSAAPTPTTVVSSAASLRAGRWSVEIRCPAGENFRERTITMALSSATDTLIAEHGEPETPLSLSLRGVQDTDGSLWLRGKCVSGLRAGARTYPPGFFVKPAGERYEGRGRLGRRECPVVISRAP